MQRANKGCHRNDLPSPHALAPLAFSPERSREGLTVGAKTKWTPGPWTASDAKYAVDGAYDIGIGADIGVGRPTVIAEAFGKVHESLPVSTRANATLIASAPDLYEALAAAQELLADLARPAEGASVGNAWARCVEIELKARNALARARGDSSP